MKRLSLVFSFCVFLVGCNHKPARVAVAPAPPIQTSGPNSESTREPQPSTTLEVPIEVSPDTEPLLVETGIASWYGPPYHNRRASNGEIYDMHAMTAAHRTLPLGSIVRVTSLDSSDSCIVRITDRGPFIEGRIVDLSQAAAAKIGLVKKGTGQVRLEVLQTPAPIESGGKWAVQIGGFGREEDARNLAGHLTRRYQTAKVLTFNSPAGDWWVRVRVKDDLRARAEEVLHAATTTEGGIFLVRLD